MSDLTCAEWANAKLESCTRISWNLATASSSLPSSLSLSASSYSWLLIAMETHSVKAFFWGLDAASLAVPRPQGTGCANNFAVAK